MRKNAAVTAHINGVNGRAKDQALELIFFTGATTTSPDSIYGRVKSTILVRFVTMAISPTTPSKTYRNTISELIEKKIVNQSFYLLRKQMQFS